MGRKFSNVKKILLFSTVLMTSLLVAPLAAADVNNFYFSNFTADYYLEKDDQHGSRLRVDERLIAEFPDFDQNKGIVRAIPRTNDGGRNRVLAKDFEVTVTRNDHPEQIYATENTADAHYISTGTESYLRGPQNFRLQYEFIRVITDFDDYQELYWNTTGTGWSQTFNKITARVHLPLDILDNFTGETKCFVGPHGSTDETGCKMSRRGNIFTFESTGQVPAGHTLTFALKFKPGSFIVPEPDINYGIFGFSIAAAVVAVSLVIFAVWRFIIGIYRPKRANQKTIIPQYLPPKNFTVAEAANIYSKDGAGIMAAQIIDLAVRHKIRLIEDKKKSLGSAKYSIEIIDDSGWQSGDKKLIQALGGEITNGATVDLSQTDFARRAKLQRYSLEIYNDIAKLGLVKPKKQIWFAALAPISALITILIFMIGATMIDGATGDIIYGGTALLYICMAIGTAICIACIMLSRQEKQWSNLTDKGFNMYYYLKGVEDYIKFAESERLKFLQSPGNAERINLSDKKSVVKLYERMLPYAMIFRQEKKWAKQLEIYYSEVYQTPSWYSGAGFNAAVFASSMSSFSSSMSTNYGTGGGSSSSGGFGGGGAGGGGGGGGGGGR